MRFVEHPSGLYVFDSSPAPICTVEPALEYTMVVTTVTEQRKQFSKRQVAEADDARAFYRKVGRPDENEFTSMLKNNWIRNCPVTPDTARCVLAIYYGPGVTVLKGKMTRSDAAPRAPTFEAVMIPPPIHR